MAPLQAVLQFPQGAADGIGLVFRHHVQIVISDLDEQHVLHDAKPVCEPLALKIQRFFLSILTQKARELIGVYGLILHHGNPDHHSTPLGLLHLHPADKANRNAGQSGKLYDTASRPEVLGTGRDATPHEKGRDHSRP